jgi:hypothetical protein
MTRMDVSEGPIVPATRNGFGSRAGNPPVTQMPSGASQSAAKNSSRNSNAGSSGANAGDARVWDNDDDSSDQNSSNQSGVAGSSASGLSRTGSANGFRGTQSAGTEDDDAGSNFRSILSQLSGSQADEDEDAQGGSSQPAQNAKKQIAGSGDANSGKATLGRTADLATTPLDVAGAAKQILPFALGFSGTRELISSDEDSPGTSTSTAAARGAGNASGSHKDVAGHDASDAVHDAGRDSVHNSLHDSLHDSDRQSFSPQSSRMALDAQDDATTQVSADASNGHSGELAFAAKLIPNSNDSAAQSTIAVQANAAGVQANQKSSAATAAASSTGALSTGALSTGALSTGASSTGASSTTSNASNMTGANAGGTGGDQGGAAGEGFMRQAAIYSQESGAGHAGAASKTESSTPASSVDSPASARLGQSIELKPAAPASPSDITVRIPDSGRGTDVRFVERAGEVHVSVKTSDPGMAQTLRGGLNDFAARMDQTGIRAELWQPGSGGGSDSSSSQSGSDERQSDQHSGDQSNARRDQAAGSDPEDGQQNSKKPKWVEALEMSIGRQ